MRWQEDHEPPYGKGMSGDGSWLPTLIFIAILYFTLMGVYVFFGQFVAFVLGVLFLIIVVVIALLPIEK